MSANSATGPSSSSTASAAPSSSPRSPHSRNQLVDRSLDIQLLAGQCRYFFKWGCINAVLLSIVLYDMAQRQRHQQNCPYASSVGSDAADALAENLDWWWHQAEQGLAVLLALSICYNFVRLFYGRLSMQPLRGTVEQRRLLRFDDGDASFVTDSGDGGRHTEAKVPAINNTLLNVSGLSWHSSFNESTRSFVPPGWLYNRGSPAGGGSTHTSFHNASAQHNSLHNGSQQLNTSSAAWSTHNASSLNASTNNASAAASFSSPYRNYNKRDIITDEHELQKYLRSDPYGAGASAAAQDDSSADVNALNTLRAYCNSAAHLLKQSLYQISPASVSPGKALSSSAKDDLVSGIFASLSGSDGGGAGGNISATNATLGGGGGGSVFDGVVGAAAAGLASASAAAASASEADESYELQRLSANGQLTQSIYNLRGWLAVTIVQRLDAEIEKTNRALGGNTQAEYRGFTDVQIGKVGLERLRKTAEVQPLVAAYVPMLPRIVDFVQVSSNQEYLVQRLHDLARGCVLAEYRWNGGGTYGGVAWDEHLHPTDAQIMFHLFCTYLDGQLPPLPQPGGRPFYTRYVVHGDKRTADEIKAEVRNKSGCAILCTSAPQRPRFNFITTRTIHSSVHDRNNLFNVIVEFLVYMRTHNEGMLESINLGRSGINLLRVIGD